MRAGLLITGAVIAAFCGALIFLILRIVRAMAGKTIAVLEAAEGVVRRSGRLTTSIHLTGYSSSHMRSSGMISRRKAELVLTRRGLVLVTPYAIRLGDAPYDALSVKVNKAGVLHLKTTQPPDATGTVEVWIKVSAPLEWVDALGIPRERAI